VDGIFRSQIGPAQWNLTLAAFLVEETNSLFTTVFFARQSFELATRERMKGMCDPKPLGLCSTNVCSLMPTSLNSSTLRIRFELQGRAGPKRISPYPPQSDRRPNGGQSSAPLERRSQNRHPQKSKGAASGRSHREANAVFLRDDEVHLSCRDIFDLNRVGIHFCARQGISLLVNDSPLTVPKAAVVDVCCASHSHIPLPRRRKVGR
jgi:hypothetical protein